MSWLVNDDVIHEINGDAICRIADDIDSFSLGLIKKTPEIMNLFFQFRDVYEARKKISKKLFVNFCDLIEENQDYNFKWLLDKDGYLINKNNNKPLCLFFDKKAMHAIFAQFLPEIIGAIKINTAAFKSTDAKQKPLYDSLSKIIKKIDNYE